MKCEPTADVHMALLCGGQNTRLGALSGTLYKPFLPVRTLSLVARHVMRAALAGVRAITIIVDHLDPLVLTYVESIRRDVGAFCSLEVMALEGTTAAKIRAFHVARPEQSRLVVVLGDTYAHYDPVLLASEARRPGVDSAMTVGTFRLPFGVVETADGFVTGFQEKPETVYQVNLGQLALGPIALRLLTEGYEVDAMLADLASSRCMTTIELGTEFLTVDTIADVAAAFTSDLLEDVEVTAGRASLTQRRGEHEHLERTG